MSILRGGKAIEKGEDKLTTEKKMKQRLNDIKRALYGRMFMILLGFVAQLVMLMLSYRWLSNYNVWFYFLFLLISVIAVIHIYNDRSNPDLRLSWMLPIAIFPVFGAIFYITIISRPGTKVMYRKIKKLSEQTKRNVQSGILVRKKLSAEHPQMGRLAHYLENFDNSPVYTNTQAKYFPLGDAQFVAMLEELEKAEKFIFMEFFIVDVGQMLDKILEVLRRKARAGVEVRFMCDGTNVLWNIPYRFLKELEKDGIKCKMFAPIKPIFSPHYNNRDHRKILVIDGKVAFTGGINLADEYINQKVRFGHWKDTGVMLQGEAVERFTYMFLELWNESELVLEKYAKYRTPVEASVPSDGYVIPYSVCPLGPERVGERVYLDIIQMAHSYVHIMTPYLILDHQMMMALSYAAKRGVEVIIVMPHIPDKKYAFLLAKTYYNQLLEAGVKICEYEPGFVHAKVVVADGDKAVVGTVNFDYRSLYHHFECGAVFYRNSRIAEMEADVQDTLKKCIQVTPEDYKKQKLMDRFFGKLMRIIAPLM